MWTLIVVAPDVSHDTMMSDLIACKLSRVLRRLHVTNNALPCVRDLNLTSRLGVNGTRSQVAAKCTVRAWGLPKRQAPRLVATSASGILIASDDDSRLRPRTITSQAPSFPPKFNLRQTSASYYDYCDSERVTHNGELFRPEGQEAGRRQWCRGPEAGQAYATFEGAALG